jgi:ring-1,2-phenylacetyl-CoA epoxidase subunit PaaE
VERLTDDAIAIRFDLPDQLRAEYEFVQGQHVAVCAPAAADDVRRSYSICSVAGSGELRIAVKQLPSGILSTYLHEQLRPGDELDVMTPAGRFSVQLDPTRQRHYVAVAAGSGITPIMSIAATSLAVEPASRFTLLYGNRTARSVMFLDELADLKDRYLDRFALHHVLSRETGEADLLHGRIDGDKLRAVVDRVVAPVDHWFLCGPEPMLNTLGSILLDLGVDKHCIHRELFYAGPPAATAAGETATAGLAHVTIVLDGRASSFEMPRKGKSILDAAMEVRPDAPYACKGGVCGTCRARVLEGEVALDRAFALEDDELAAGFILTCQAHPVTASVRIDYDA